MRGAKNSWTLFLLILAGVVLGGFVGTLAADVPVLDWLNYGQSFGLEEPVVLSLGLLVLTFGLTIRTHDCRDSGNYSCDIYLSLDIEVKKGRY